MKSQKKKISTSCAIGIGIVLILIAAFAVRAVFIMSQSSNRDRVHQADDVRQAAASETIDNVAASETNENIGASETIENVGVSGKSDLRILYVGLPDTERQKDFVTFLGQHFKQVDTADYNAFDEEQTKDYDVAILDKDGIEWAALDINVSREYSRATVSIGVPGAFWIRRVSRKMGYM